MDETVKKYVEQDLARVSIISIWELAMLASKRRIVPPVDCMTWIQRALRGPGVGLEEMTPEIAVASTRLPGNPPSDPSDRIIIASAMSLGAVLATHDQEIIAYAEEQRLPILTV